MVEQQQQQQRSHLSHVEWLEIDWVLLAERVGVSFGVDPTSPPHHRAIDINNGLLLLLLLLSLSLSFAAAAISQANFGLFDEGKERNQS